MPGREAEARSSPSDNQKQGGDNIVRFSQKLSPLILLLALSACATFPTGPSVRVLPGQGKSFDAFQSEDAKCRQWAEQHPGLPAQQVYENNVAAGAIAGTAIGAGLGAALGAASCNTGAGAAIGAASGLLIGSSAGSQSGMAYGMEAQRRYDNAYAQCMYTYGNQIPGYHPAAPSRQAANVTPPPPPPPGPLMPPADMSAPDMPPVPPDLAPESVQYAPPPMVKVEEAPQFIYAPPLNLYVAVGVPYDLVYTGSEYFNFYGGRWFRGRYYDGPWVLASRNYLPPALLRYRINRIRHYRDLEFRSYQHDRAHYNGRFHRPEFHGEHRKVVHRD
jgi:outer membrane lipoprotein SlyB